MQGIKFLEDCTLTVYESATDETGTPEVFTKNEVSDADIIEDKGSAVDIQFGEGSVAFNIPKNAIEVIEISYP